MISRVKSFGVLVASSSIKDEQQHRENKADLKHEDEVLLNMIRPDYERPPPPPAMEPLYCLTEDGKVQGKHIVLLKPKHSKV